MGSGVHSLFALTWMGEPPSRWQGAEGVVVSMARERLTGPGAIVSWSPPRGDRPERSEEDVVVALQPHSRGVPGWIDQPTLRELVLAGPSATKRVHPPFAMLRCSGDLKTVDVLVDAMGFRHLYCARGADWAAVSTSARALGVLVGGGLDQRTLEAQSLLGWQLGLDTVFAGVSKIAPGSLTTMTAGRIDVQTHERTDRPETFAGDLDDAVERAAEIIRGVVAAALADQPEILLQLTGGLDSRILLGAIPPDQRKQVTCMTLAVPGSPDLALAQRLTSAYGMGHRIVTLDAVSRTSVEEAHERVLAAARRIDAASDPVAAAALAIVEGDLDSVPRLSGLGGEVVRGFYYTAPALRGLRRRTKVSRLARWRLFPNESVPDEALRSDIRAERRGRVISRLQDIFDGYPSQWNDATDRFYLAQRMQRWAGVLASATSSRRSVVNPMLDPRFLDLGASLPWQWKANARFLSRILQELDPELASIPLDGRPAPLAYAFPGPGSRLQLTALTARKVAGKAQQRLRARGRPPAGGVSLSDLVVQAWQRSPALLNGVRDMGVLDPVWLEAMLSGRSVSPSAVAMVADLEAVADILREGPTGEAYG